MLQGFYYSDDNSVVKPSNTIIINAKENDFSSTRTVETILPTPKVETISHVEELGAAIRTSTNSSIDFDDYSSTRTVETILPTPKVETISHVEELGAAIQTSTDSSIDFDVQLPVEVTTWYVQYIYA